MSVKNIELGLPEGPLKDVATASSESNNASNPIVESPSNGTGAANGHGDAPIATSDKRELEEKEEEEQAGDIPSAKRQRVEEEGHNNDSVTTTNNDNEGDTVMKDNEINGGDLFGDENEQEPAAKEPENKSQEEEKPQEAPVKAESQPEPQAAPQSPQPQPQPQQQEAQQSEKIVEENDDDNPEVKEEGTTENGDGNETPQKEEEQKEEGQKEEEHGLAKHQFKFASQVLRQVKRLKDAGPFLQPVDAVKLNVPTYYELIKTPMDLSKIDKKLQAEEYQSVDEFRADMDLIVSNCVYFNGPDTGISEMAKSIKASFEKYMTNFPAYDAVPTSKPKKKSSILPPAAAAAVNKPATKPQRSAAGAANAAIAHASQPLTKSPAKATPSKQSAVAAAVPAAAATASAAAGAGASGSASKPFALAPNGMPTIRRDSAPDGRPKREIHPPKPKDLMYGDLRPRKKKFQAELKFCGQVLRELMSKKHEAYSYPFLQPVDPVAFNCPNYFDIIKKPMDLSTVQQKYNNNQYENADEFEADVRLMFDNCYKYNPEGTPVNMMGHRLEQLFDKKWADKPIPAPTPPPPEPDSDEFDSELDEEEITNPAIKYLEEQLRKMTEELAKMKKDAIREAREKRGKRRGGGRRDSAARRKSSLGGRRGSTSGKDTVPVVTYEMKKELSEMISDLPEKKLQHVIKIIQESMPSLPEGQEEIELDIDQLDPQVILKLYNFVVRKDPKKSRKSTGTGAPRPKKKSKPLTEEEQSRQIRQIEKKIRQFDRAEGGGIGDSSDEESSGDEAGSVLGGGTPGMYGNGHLSSDDSSSEEE
ncbi:bromodomain-containing factor 1 [Trichomonascus vanleenenianus]|uniref:bromodomain-containing protein n=1 Tax=Trichomonascus vanleenenianus TaxID=2268995 RepID=UPI003EC967C6